VESLALTANYAQGFRAPMLNEMFLDGVHFAFPMSPGVTVLGIFRPNPQLEPESSESIDFGLRYRNRRLDARIGYYHTHVDDFIDTIFNDQVFAPAQGLLFWYFDTLNVASATLRGWEASASWMPIDALLLRAAWAAPRGENDATGARLGTIPPDKLAVGVEGRPLPGLTLGLNGRFYGADPGEEEVREPQDAFRLFDLYASWQPRPIPGVTLYFNVDNLGDTAYDVPPFGMPGTGRDYRVGMAWSLGR
jgi:hemoglobin/transferrin/lactoferrin receptor protein